MLIRSGLELFLIDGIQRTEYKNKYVYATKGLDRDLQHSRYTRVTSWAQKSHSIYILLILTFNHTVPA